MSILGVANNDMSMMSPGWKVLDMMVYKLSRGPGQPHMSRFNDWELLESLSLFNTKSLLNWATSSFGKSGGAFFFAFEEADPAYRRLRLDKRIRHHDPLRAAYDKRQRQLSSGRGSVSSSDEVCT